MSKDLKMNRRDFLAAMGLAGGSLFLPSLLPRSAHATDALPPKRMVVFFTQHGTWYDGWKMRWPGLPENQHWAKDLTNVPVNEFSPALRPLHTHRDKLMVVDGLALVSAEADASGLRHELAYVHALTGANSELVSGIPLAGAASIDQRIADVLARPDRFRSIETGIGDPPSLTNFSRAKEFLPVEKNPRQTYQRLFGLSGSNNLSSSEQVWGAHGSLLDKVKSRYANLSGRLSSEDKIKLETHRELVHSLEQQVQGLSNLTCDSSDIVPVGIEDYEKDFAATVKMMSAAFACDLTRIFTVAMDTIPGDLVIPDRMGDIHDEYAHNVYLSQDAQEAMTHYTELHAQHFAAILSALDAVPEGNGTMLDNTLCLWVVEVADGAHGFDRWPAVMAGGQGMQMGRYMHYPRNTPYAGWQWDLGTTTSMGVPHQKFLTTVCQSMGLNVNNMPVETIRGIGGTTIDCRGVLEGVFT